MAAAVIPARTDMNMVMARIANIMFISTSTYLMLDYIETLPHA